MTTASTTALRCALYLLAVALPLGEGPSAVAAGWLAVCLGQLFCAEQRLVAAPAVALLPATLEVRWVLLAASSGAVLAVNAALAGPWGLRPSALGSLVPLLALGLVARTGQIVGMQACARACRIFVGACVVAAAYGLLAAAFGSNFGESLVRLDAFTGAQGLVPGSQRRVAAGFYFHRLKMAHLLLVALAPAVASAVDEGKTRRQRALACCTVGFLGLALLATYARAAVLACGAAAGVVLVWGRLPWRSWRQLVGGAALAVAVAAALAPNALRRACSAHESDAAAVRAVIWSQAVAIARDAPFGVGLGNYRDVVAGYYDLAEPLTPSPRTAPHARLLATLVEAGPAGMVIDLAVWAGLFGLACAAARSVGDAHRRAAGRAGLWAVTALAAAGLTHDVLYHRAIAWVVWSAMGLLLATTAPIGQDRRPRERSDESRVGTRLAAATARR